jgi:hypothetical protein
MSFSKALCNQIGRARLIHVYTGITDNAVLIKVRRPYRCISFPYHTCNRSTTLSTRGCSVALGSLDIERGVPRYFIANWVI